MTVTDIEMATTAVAIMAVVDEAEAIDRKQRNFYVF